MLIQVYRYTGQHTRNIVTAQLVAEVEVDEFPDDQIEFAEEHDGDFIEIATDLQAA